MVGGLVLGYGFANVGVVPGIPLPLADLVVVVVGSYSLTTARRWPSFPPAFITAGLYALIATCRLIIDLPTWGKDALRDYSLAVEMLSLPLGYWVILRFGLPRLSRLLAWTFVVVIAYSWLYPLRELIGSLGPSVRPADTGDSIRILQCAGACVCILLLRYRATLQRLGVDCGGSLAPDRVSAVSRLVHRFASVRPASRHVGTRRKRSATSALH